MLFDLAVCGAGPAGAAAALAAARAGWRVALIERAIFPRHKVCGDCLNPSVWPVLESLGTAEAIRSLDHAALDRVRFTALSGRPLEIPLPAGAERAVTRESFDGVMLQAALNAGVRLFAGAPLLSLQSRENLWKAITADETLTAKTFIAADGRNSTSCRLLGISPASRPGPDGRIALQCHAPRHPDYQNTVALELMPHGYCGIAPVDSARMNLCLVSGPRQLAAAKQQIHQRFGLPDDQAWHSITPLERPDVPPVPVPGCFLAGDAARVVEPFTGEGIYYALRSGQLAAEAVTRHLQGNPAAAAGFYRQAHQRLYHRRLWVNRLARLAVTHRRFGSLLLQAGRLCPALMRHLTAKVVGSQAEAAGS